MKKILASLALVLLSQNSQARIGETFEQCTERYGELTQHKDDPSMFLVFVGDFGIAMTFRSNVCQAIAYTKTKKDAIDRPEKMSANEVEILAKNNFGDKPFTKRVIGEEIAMQANDFSLGATYKPDSRYLVVLTKAEAERMQDQTKAKEAENLKGL